MDEQGLRTWAVDGQAMVQAANSQQWRPLKEVLAEAAASRPGPSSPRGRLDDGIPLIPLKPIDGEPSSRAAARGTAPDEDGRARTPKGLLQGAVLAHHYRDMAVLGFPLPPPTVLAPLAAVGRRMGMRAGEFKNL